MYTLLCWLLRELARENLWSRIHLVPLLTAEADRDLYRRTEAAKAREAEIMKDVDGWKVGESVYNNTKYFNAPSYVIVPEQQKSE
jgi:NADH dehydrogenase (ubiquinone) 1 alpha subcomplex subunit 13